MSRGYLPNSPYTKQFGVVTLTPKILFKNCKCSFQYCRSFVHTKKKLVEQAQKALYAVYYKIRNLQLPIDLQLKIFHSLVAPILLYGSEVWGVVSIIYSNH
jgi:hypothetical protein